MKVDLVCLATKPAAGPFHPTQTKAASPQCVGRQPTIKSLVDLEIVAPGPDRQMQLAQGCSFFVDYGRSFRTGVVLEHPPEVALPDTTFASSFRDLEIPTVDRHRRQQLLVEVFASEEAATWTTIIT